MTQGHLTTRFRIHSMFTNYSARPFYRSLGPRFVLWPFANSRYYPFPTHVCIHNSEFHSTFLSHMAFLCSVRRMLDTAGAYFPESLSIHCQGLRHTISEICTKFYGHSFSNSLRNWFETDAGLKTKGCAANPSGGVTFCTRIPNIS
jgi:hypothetical protein